MHTTSGRRGRMAIHIRRREFIFTLGGAAAAWPLAARAQQPTRMRRIGVLMGRAAGDPEGQKQAAAFQQGLEELRRSSPHNVETEFRWTAGDAARAPSIATAGRSRRASRGAASHAWSPSAFADRHPGAGAIAR